MGKVAPFPLFPVYPAVSFTSSNASPATFLTSLDLSVIARIDSFLWCLPAACLLIPDITP